MDAAAGATPAAIAAPCCRILNEIEIAIGIAIGMEIAMRSMKYETRNRNSQALLINNKAALTIFRVFLGAEINA